MIRFIKIKNQLRFRCLPITLVFIVSSGTLQAQIGDRWPPISKYDQMACYELSIELSFIRKDLLTLQESKYLADPKWDEAVNRFNYLIAIYQQKCRSLPADQTQLPKPSASSLPSEAELLKQAKQALKNSRFAQARTLLQAGANAGYAGAQYELGMLLTVLGEIQDSKYWLRRAAQQGHRDAKQTLQILENQ